VHFAVNLTWQVFTELRLEQITAQMPLKKYAKKHQLTDTVNTVSHINVTALSCAFLFGFELQFGHTVLNMT